MNRLLKCVCAALGRKPFSEVISTTRHVINCFGPGRCMFESNVPPDRDSCSYRLLWNMFKLIAAAKGMSAADKKAIFHDTAVRAYKLDEDFYAKL